jgi:predicted N-acetyltransferase YhbS
MAYRKPEPIRPSHDLSRFDCADEAMNEWLRERALDNEAKGVTRTFVLCEDGGNSVVGFFGLTVGTMLRSTLRGKHRHGMPTEIPLALLGRLAVDRAHQGRGLAKALVREAIHTAILAARHAGIAVIAVQAKDDGVAGFYGSLGFTRAQHDPLMFFLRLADVAATFPEVE